MRKTKIVCTLGPATDREGVLRQMLEAGMNVARFNFSHGSHAEHKGRLDALKALRAEPDKRTACLTKASHYDKNERFQDYLRLYAKLLHEE